MWIDLLGYGSMLREVNFNPDHPQAQEAVKRLKLFHNTLDAASGRSYNIQQINDGAVVTTDTSPRTRLVSFNFLRRSIELFQLINRLDVENSHPGARAVIAVGPRVRMLDAPRTDSTRLTNLIERYRQNAVSAEEAIHEASRALPTFGAFPLIQANFAFTRAYLADQSGSKAGIAGPNCYIDLQLFSDPPPPWIKFNNVVDWQTQGMATKFGRFDYLDEKLAKESKLDGINNAHDIARIMGVSLIK